MSEPARDATGGHEHVQRGVVGAVGAIGLATLTSRVGGSLEKGLSDLPVATTARAITRPRLIGGPSTSSCTTRS